RRRRRILLGRADDEMGQRYVPGGDVVGLLALLAERQGDIPLGGADLVQIEDHRIPVRALLEVGAGIGNMIDELRLEGWIGGRRSSCVRWRPVPVARWELRGLCC